MQETYKKSRTKYYISIFFRKYHANKKIDFGSLVIYPFTLTREIMYFFVLFFFSEESFNPKTSEDRMKGIFDVAR